MPHKLSKEAWERGVVTFLYNAVKLSFWPLLCSMVCLLNSKAIKSVKVTLKIKGKTYTAKTNSNGKAIFKITKLTKKGKYSAKIKFAGNGYYKASSASKTITIK